ncbi:MAG: four-carbon acid sugar kinase family protein [Burkholderiaceae bacterium]|nr:four-carbon acid sugar kinase family protein [Burkholderiaceae bacterium]
MGKILLGCIADDFTGATDLANNLVRAGMRVVQTNGVPTKPLSMEVDAVVVALKSRTIASTDAIAQSLDALRWLKQAGSQQIYFKYCSTFDSWYGADGSDKRGNIGPVTESLMDAMDLDFTIATPAFPDNGRTVFKGHLFVGDVLLSESSMKTHPLTPMLDANLVKVLQAQCHRKVGLIDYRAVAAGTEAVRARIAELQAEGVGIAIVDAVSNEDLMRLGRALADLPLVTAGSGVAIGLPQNFGIQATGEATSQAARLPNATGWQAVVSGSCSQATNAQVAAWQASGKPHRALDLAAVLGSDAELGAEVQNVLTWAQPLLAQGPVLVYSTADAESVKNTQNALGSDATGARVEHALSAIAKGLVELGVQQLVVAGGETSGACVQALGVQQMQIGSQIDPGVPWCYAQASAVGVNVHLALKSGNFGATDFFAKAFKLLER